MSDVAKKIALILCLNLVWSAAFAKGHHTTVKPKPKHRSAVHATHSSENAANHAALVVDAASGAVLHAHNAGEPWYPASLTKMMTAYLAFDAMESGRLKADDTLTVSQRAAAQGGSRLGLRSGERIRLDDAIRGLIVRSANDAAVTLAEHIGGSESEFAADMTNKARQIGMSHTTFHNATGLPHAEQITTAHDMAVLAQTLIRQYPEHYHYFQADSVTFHHRNIGAINPLLRSYPGAEGMKTGFTCASGYNIVGAAKRDGRRLIAVYLGGSSRNRRNSEVTHLLDAGFADTRDVTRLPSLDDAVIRQASHAQPIRRLGQDVCYSTVPMEGGDAAATTSSNADKATQRAWGVIVGDFPSRKNVQGALKKLRSDAPRLVASSSSRIITRRQPGKNSQHYAALLTGLQRDEADQLCGNRDWEQGVRCTALSPNDLRVVR